MVEIDRLRLPEKNSRKVMKGQHFRSDGPRFTGRKRVFRGAHHRPADTQGHLLGDPPLSALTSLGWPINWSLMPALVNVIGMSKNKMWLVTRYSLSHKTHPWTEGTSLWWELSRGFQRALISTCSPGDIWSIGDSKLSMNLNEWYSVSRFSDNCMTRGSRNFLSSP